MLPALRSIAIFSDSEPQSSRDKQTGPSVSRDFCDVHYPKAVAWYVPPVRSDSARKTGHADDVFVMEDGTIFGSSSDQGAGGLWALRRAAGFRGTVRWNAEESGVIVT